MASVGGERGDPVPIDVGDPQLRSGVGSFFAGDDPTRLFYVCQAVISSVWSALRVRYNWRAR